MNDTTMIHKLARSKADTAHLDQIQSASVFSSSTICLSSELKYPQLYSFNSGCDMIFFNSAYQLYTICDLRYITPKAYDLQF
jgi:hypothetical protein